MSSNAFPQYCSARQANTIMRSLPRSSCRRRNRTTLRVPCSRVRLLVCRYGLPAGCRDSGIAFEREHELATVNNRVVFWPFDHNPTVENTLCLLNT